MRRVPVWTVVLVVASVVVGMATGLGGLSSRELGAGGTTVVPCDPNGFSTNYLVFGGNVSAVIVGGIADPGCEGGRLSLTLTNNAASAGLGSLTLPADGDTTNNTVLVPVAPQPPASTVDGIHIAITGP